MLFTARNSNSAVPSRNSPARAATAFETLLVKVETDAGIVGWGEAFPHRIWPAVKWLFENLIAPACVGVDPLGIAALMKTLIYRVHGVGRAGPAMYALSGLDIALWDILGKANNQPIYKLLGSAHCAKVPAYASLLKYAETDVVMRTCEEAFARGYRDLKVHETGRNEITVAANLLRKHNGGALIVDVNAPWTLPEALAATAPLRELRLKWIEEPVWPPEDFDGVRQISASGVPVAIGENVLTPADFTRLIDSRAVDYVQPSVAKIGGISIARDIFAAANAGNIAVAPHSAYFGPGLIATAHLSAALSRAPMIERLYCELMESPFGDWYDPVDGYLMVPQGSGLGVEPDQTILDRLRAIDERGHDENSTGQNQSRAASAGRTFGRRTTDARHAARIPHGADPDRRRHRGHWCH